MPERDLTSLEQLLDERHTNLVNQITRVLAGLQQDLQASLAEDRMSATDAQTSRIEQRLDALDAQIRVIIERLAHGDLHFARIDAQIQQSEPQ